MISIEPSRWKLPPYAHQVQGVKDLIAKPVLGLFWTMRAGKTATIINTACTLFEAGELDAVVVAAPAQVVGVWADRELGEIKTHCWVNHLVVRFEGNCFLPKPGYKGLTFFLASLEYLRQEGDRSCYYPKVESLLYAVQGKKWWLAVDEASALANPTSAQTRAIMKL